MDGIQEGKQERHRNGFNFAFFQEADQSLNRLLGEVFNDCAGVINPLWQSKAQLPRGQGRCPVHLKIIEFGPRLPANLQHVFKAHGGH